MRMFLVFLLIIQPAGLHAAGATGNAEKIISELRDCSFPGLWERAAQLRRLGEEATASIENGLKSESNRVKLVCAEVLFSLGEAEKAEKALRRIADSQAPSRLRVASLILLRRSLDPELPAVLKRLAQSDPDPLVRIEAARTLWEVAEGRAAREILERFLHSEEKRLRDRAALALGQIGYVQGVTKRVLARLAGEPSPLGRRASLVLELERMAKQGEASANPFGLGEQELLKEKEARIAQLREELEHLRQANLGKGGGGNPLLEWIQKVVHDNYVDKDRLQDVDLLVGAAKGILDPLDRFSSFMDVTETQRFKESIGGSYTGIGAQISQDPETGHLIIERPLYKGPAYQAQLKPGDRILKIEGVPTKDKPMSELVSRLKGKSQTKVTLEISRRGWKEPREFELVRKKINVKTVHSRVLPSGIGYMRLDNFGKKSFREVKHELRNMSIQGMEGLVLDLRGNPGGLLSAAVNVVDLFVGKEARPIVIQKGPTGEKAELTHDIEPQYLTVPMAVLVNGSSASASEIVAGALQDFDHRAILVGKRTFGKGSVQRIFPVPPPLTALVGGQTELRLTVQYYYLPNGRCIHTRRDSEGRVIEKGGVIPDIEVPKPEYSLAKLTQMEKLAENAELTAYVKDLLKDHRDEVKRLLLHGDGGNPEGYPGFAAFSSKISGETTLDSEEIRILLRSELKRAYENVRGRELACDFQDDVQLQRAIVEVLKRLSVDPKTEPDYRSFSCLEGVSSKDKKGEVSGEKTPVLSKP